MKKLFTSLFATSLVALAACGNAADEPAAPEYTPASEPAPEVVAEPQETIELDFWHAMQGPHEAALEALIERFHAEHPYIRINAEWQGNYTQINDAISAAALGNALPHLVQQTTDNITGWFHDGILVSLDQFINDPEIGLSQEQIDDIIEVFLEGVIWDGEFQSIPFGKSTRVLYVNLDLLEEYGFDIPTSWEQIAEMAEAMRNVEANRFGMGFENGWGAEFIALTRQFGGEYIDEATATAVFGEAEGIAAAQFVIDLYEADLVRFAGEDNHLSGVFGNGFVAMYIGSSAGLPHVTAAIETSENPFNWTTAILPTYNGNAATRFQGNDIVMMENGMSDEEQLAAWTFMAFTLRPEETAQWAADSGYVPVTYTGREHAVFQDFLAANPHAAAASDQFDAGFMTARVEGANLVWQILVEELANIRLGIDDVETALTRAQDRANEALGN